MAKRKIKMKAEEIEAQRIEAHEIPSTQPKMEPEPTQEDIDAYEEQQREERAPHPANDAVDIVPEWKDGEIMDESDAVTGLDQEPVEDEYGPVEMDPSEDEEEPKPNSVVAEKFKLKYIENAKAVGAAGKAAKRSSWDWLAQRIAEQCLGEKEKININDFMDLLECNGVDYSKWTNRNKGWEGRFRMTGRVVLQKVVANNGVLKTMTGESVPPPEWVERFKPKQ